LDVNYFNANTLFGTTTNAGYKVDVSGTARVTQSAYFATASGSVGIGTTSPLQKLYVIGNSVFRVPSGNVYAQVESGSATFSIATDGTSHFVYGTTNIPIEFSTNGSARMRIFANGNVRIASSFTDTGRLFQVGGNMDILNTSYIGDSIFSSSRITFNNSMTIGANSNVIVETNGANTCATFTNSYNFGLRQSTFGTSATNTVAIANGTAPASSPANCFQLYSAAVTAGNAAAHFRTENGAIIKVYQETTAVGSATVSSPGAGSTIKTDDTFDGYTLQQVVKALRNQGLLQ